MIKKSLRLPVGLTVGLAASHCCLGRPLAMAPHLAVTNREAGFLFSVGPAMLNKDFIVNGRGGEEVKAKGSEPDWGRA